MVKTIMAKKFPRVATGIKLRIQEAYRTPNSIKTNKTKHITLHLNFIVKLLKTKDNLLGSQRKQDTVPKMTKKYCGLLVRNHANKETMVCMVIKH